MLSIRRLLWLFFENEGQASTPLQSSLVSVKLFHPKKRLNSKYFSLPCVRKRLFQRDWPKREVGAGATAQNPRLQRGLLKLGETSNWGRLLSLKETHHAAVFWSFIQRSFSVQVCHTETFVVAPNQIPEDVSVQLVEFRLCSGIVMSHCISLFVRLSYTQGSLGQRAKVFVQLGIHEAELCIASVPTVNSERSMLPHSNSELVFPGFINTCTWIAAGLGPKNMQTSHAWAQPLPREAVLSLQPPVSLHITSPCPLLLFAIITTANHLCPVDQSPLSK